MWVRERMREAYYLQSLGDLCLFHLVASTSTGVVSSLLESFVNEEKSESIEDSAGGLGTFLEVAHTSLE